MKKSLKAMAFKMAPEEGLEPTTTRLTAACSTIELLWNSESREIYRLGPLRQRIFPQCRTFQCIPELLVGLVALSTLRGKCHGGRATKPTRAERVVQSRSKRVSVRPCAARRLARASRSTNLMHPPWVPARFWLSLRKARWHTRARGNSERFDSGRGGWHRFIGPASRAHLRRNGGLGRGGVRRRL